MKPSRCAGETLRTANGSQHPQSIAFSRFVVNDGYRPVNGGNYIAAEQTVRLALAPGGGESAAKLIESIGGAIAGLLWVLLAIGSVFLFRDQLRALLDNFGSFEGFGLRLSISDRALNDAIRNVELTATLERGEAIVIPTVDRDRVLARAKRERALLEGAEILWIDDRPSNNRNEARMLHAFGALITFAASTEQALDALRRSAEQFQPFHLILSDIDRAPPDAERDAGLRMIPDLRAANVVLPIIFYILRPDPAKGIPAGAFGITNRPDQLLQLVLDALARTRR